MIFGDNVSQSGNRQKVAYLSALCLMAWLSAVRSGLPLWKEFLVVEKAKLIKFFVIYTFWSH